MQEHIYDKSQPENLGVPASGCARCSIATRRRPRSARSATTTRSLQPWPSTPTAATLHMAYSFDLLSAAGTPAHFRERDRRLEAIVGDGWACWSFCNHDSSAASPAGAATTPPAPAGAGWCRCCCRLRGTVCLYQGEELGLDRGRARASRSSPTRSASPSGRSSRAATAAARRCPGRRARRTAASPPASPGCRSPESHRRARSTARTATRTRCSTPPAPSRLAPRPSGAARPARSRS